ncbi:MAG: hypothetical protein JEZ06_08945 [Anaerolineaceae bacterium]|nr:hypothetical protein [Anaerolineaceae bacterium]
MDYLKNPITISDKLYELLVPDWQDQQAGRTYLSQLSELIAQGKECLKKTDVTPVTFKILIGNEIQSIKVEFQTDEWETIQFNLCTE